VNKFYCLDYYGIDTHGMEGNFWEDAGDDGNSSTGGSVTFGAHNTQHITANRKAYAMWYILARIAGWDGEF
jgi:hypothetical protein